MAIGISDLGNGLGYLYMVDANDKIIAVKPNSLSGARAMSQLGLANAPKAAQRSAVGKIYVNGCTSTGNITAITVNGVNILSSNIACATSNVNTFAGVIANAVNAVAAPSGPVYTSAALAELASLFSSPADGVTVNGYTIVVTVDDPSIDISTEPFANGSDQAGVYDSVLGYRFFIDANYGGTATPDNFGDGVEVTQYFTVRGLQAGIFTTTQTIDTDRISFERDCAITQVLLFNQGGAASDVLAYIDPTDFIDGDEVILTPGASAQVPIIEDATVTTSPIPSKNIYLTDAQPFSLANNKSISLRFKYDAVLGPIFIESGRSIALPPAGLISTTRTALVAIVNASGLAPGSFYLITDLGDAGLILQATSANTLSLGGTFIARVPDYQNTSGNFLGVWYSAMSVPTINKLVAYNGYHYRSLTGAVGTAPSGDAVNWLQLAKTDTSYLTETQYCEYDYSNNYVFKRCDKRNNSISSSYAVTALIGDAVTAFQWGSDRMYGNTVIDAMLRVINFGGTVKDNIVTKQASAVFASGASNYLVEKNEITNYHFLSGVFCLDFSGNYISSGSISNIGTISAPIGSFSRNSLYLAGIGSFTSAGHIENTYFNDNFVFKGSISSITLTGAASFFARVTGCEVYGGTITSIGITPISADAGFIECKFRTNTTVTLSNTSGVFGKCDFYEGLVFQNLTVDDAVLVGPCIFGVGIDGETFDTTVGNKYCTPAGSNFSAILDMTDAAIYTSPILTIPLVKNYCGIFLLDGGAAGTISAIANVPVDYPFTLQCNGSGSMVITPTAIGAASSGQIVSDAGNVTIVGRATASDVYVLQRQGDLNMKVRSVKLI